MTARRSHPDLADLTTAPRPGLVAVERAVDSWLLARAELAAIELIENPDITDRHGRVWTWSLRIHMYVHEGSAWDREWVLSDKIGLPNLGLLKGNSNYLLCGICRQDPDRPELRCMACDHEANCGCGCWCRLRDGDPRNELRPIERAAYAIRDGLAVTS